MLSSTPTTLNGPDGPLTVLFGEANQGQQAQCSKLTATSFCEPLSAAEYLEREEYLTQRPLTQNDGLRYRCLALAKDPAQVLETCKTIQRDILIRDRNGSRQQQCYCIVSVITDPRLRRYGLASLLLERVAEWMDGPGDATASMLYTSIGDVSINAESFGAFHPLRLAHTISILCQKKPEENSSFEVNALLSSDKDIPALCARDVEDIKANFEKYTAGPDEVLMAVLPTANLISWLHDRGDSTSLKINGEIPDAYGAICESADSWLYWHHDFWKQALGIQRVRATTVGNRRNIEGLASLLFNALREASRWKLPEAFISNPSDDLLQAMQYLQDKFGIEVECKEQIGSVPSVRWRCSDQTRDFRLHLNEHYGWS